MSRPQYGHPHREARRNLIRRLRYGQRMVCPRCHEVIEPDTPDRDVDCGHVTDAVAIAEGAPHRGWRLEHAACNRRAGAKLRAERKLLAALRRSGRFVIDSDDVSTWVSDRPRPQPTPVSAPVRRLRRPVPGEGYR